MLSFIYCYWTSGRDPRDQTCFQWVKAPDRAELEHLVATIIIERTGYYLERQALLLYDMYNSHLALEPADETDLAALVPRPRVDLIRYHVVITFIFMLLLRVAVD